MASSSTITKQQLRELLQQKQEPFVLDLYLFERGYHLKRSLSSTRLLFGCCYSNNNNNPIISCSRMLRALLNKLTPSNNKRTNIEPQRSESQLSVNEVHRNSDGHEVSELDRSSWASSSTTLPFNSPTSVIADTSERLTLGNMTEEEVCAGRDFQCQFMANNKQLSPISVLEPIPQSRHCLRTRQGHEYQTTCTVRVPNKMVVQDSTSLSDSLCQINFHSNSNMSIGDYNETMKLNGSPSPQFVLDCVREIIIATSNVNETMKKCHDKGLFGNLILERMKAWDSKQIGNDQPNNLSLASFMELDIFNGSSQEWKNGLDIEKRKISSEIGNSIADEIVSEIIAESLNPEILLKD